MRMQFTPRPTSNGRVLTVRDVIDPRIDVHAQYALMRMSRNPSTSADASAVLAAVKSGQIAGIFKEDQRAPALRARSMGLGWWEILRPGEDATVLPGRNSSGTPMLVFRDSVRANPARLDLALARAWSMLLRPLSGDFPVLVRDPVRGFVWVSSPDLTGPGLFSRVSSLAAALTPLSNVFNTEQMPHRWICHLDVDFGFHPELSPEQIIVRASGLLISPRHVLTAGHCLLTRFCKTLSCPSQDPSGRPISPIEARSVTVTPAFDIEKTPFSRATVGDKSFIRPGKDWRGSEATNRAADFGLITLPTPLVSAPEFWGQQSSARIAPLRDTALQGKQVTAAGYPSDKCPPAFRLPPLKICPSDGFVGTSQWKATGEVVGLEREVLDWLAETESGMSGGPVWLEDDRQVLHLAGIHTGFRRVRGVDSLPATGVRLTAKLLEEVRGFMRADRVRPNF